LLALADNYYTSINSTDPAVSLFLKTAVLANAFPALTIVNNGSSVTLTAPSGYQCYQWISGDIGAYTNALYPPSSGCSSQQSVTVSSGSWRCFMQDNLGNVRMSQKVYAPFITGARFASTDSTESIVPSKVYPNPSYVGFENTIEFELDYSTNVTLELVNHNGVVLQILANGIHDKGKFQYPFTFKDLHSEINTLYYRLTVDGLPQTKRIIIEK
jgi:hypothetical protein